MGKTACPLCGAACRAEDKLCGACGSRLGALGWFLKYFPGLARLKVLAAAAAAIAAGVLQLIASWRWVSGLGGKHMGGILILPFSGLTLGGAFLGYCIALCWLMVGSVCWPLGGFAELDRKKRRLFLWMVFLPWAGFLMLLFR